MRSRYSAYVLGLIDYLLATWHPSTRPASIDAALMRAGIQVASGELGGALREIEPLLSFWPRSARLWKKVASLKELAGDRAGARAARERAVPA